MCRWRRVRHSYKKCDHAWDKPDELIQCDDRLCRFSTTHPTDCVPPSCTRSCWQYRQFPEHYNIETDAFCPRCLQEESLRVDDSHA